MLKAVEAYVKGVALFTLFIRDENKENVRYVPRGHCLPSSTVCHHPLHALSWAQPTTGTRLILSA